jgi:hypothetical protein
METTIENPVIKDEGDELRNQLRDMAEEAGPLTGNEFEPEPSATKPETRAPVETVEKKPDEGDIKPDNSETEPEKAKERPRRARPVYQDRDWRRYTRGQTTASRAGEACQTVSEYEQKKAEKKQKGTGTTR